MGQPYVGEIRLIATNFAPSGWADCDGTTLSISDYETLFNLIGTTYGGDGQNTFQLPNLCGRFPLHQGSLSGTSYNIGTPAGTTQETLAVSQIPAHTHSLAGQNVAGDSDVPAGSFAHTTLNSYFNDPGGTTTTTLAANTLAATGNSQPHDNMHPYLTLRFIISLFGIYPSQS